MKNLICIVALAGLSNTAAAHSAAGNTSLHMAEHVLPVFLFVMLLGIAVKIRRKR